MNDNSPGLAEDPGYTNRLGYCADSYQCKGQHEQPDVIEGDNECIK